MKLKDRIKTYNFWLSIASAIFLIINLIGRRFNFTIDESLFNDIFTSICGIFVLLGIIAPPTKSEENSDNSYLSETSDNDNEDVTSSFENGEEINDNDIIAEMTETIYDDNLAQNSNENKDETKRPSKDNEEK